MWFWSDFIVVLMLMLCVCVWLLLCMCRSLQRWDICTLRTLFTAIWNLKTCCSPLLTHFPRYTQTHTLRHKHTHLHTVLLLKTHSHMQQVSHYEMKMSKYLKIVTWCVFPTSIFVIPKSRSVNYKFFLPLDWSTTGTRLRVPTSLTDLLTRWWRFLVNCWSFFKMKRDFFTIIYYTSAEKIEKNPFVFFFFPLISTLTKVETLCYTMLHTKCSISCM